MENGKLNLEQFVEDSMSTELQSSIEGGKYYNLRDYTDVSVSGSGPYTTYVDGIKDGDNDTF
jgi:hypothetical protein